MRYPFIYQDQIVWKTVEEFKKDAIADRQKNSQKAIVKTPSSICNQDGDISSRYLRNTRHKTKAKSMPKKLRIKEIKSDSEPEPTNNNDSQKQESENLKNPDLIVVHRIYDVVSDLGKTTLPVHETVLELIGLAIAIDKDQLATKKTLNSEESGHDKKYVVKTIYDISAALGSRTATVSETISKLIELAHRLSSPPPEVAPAKVNDPKKEKKETPDPAKVPGSDPTGAGATDTTGDGLKGDSAAKNSGPSPDKGNGKQAPSNQGAEGSRVKVTLAAPGKGAPADSVADEKKDRKEDAVPGKTSAPAENIAEKKKDGKEDVKPAEGIKYKKEVAEVAVKVEDSKLQQQFLELKLRMNLEGGETSPKTQLVNENIGNRTLLQTIAKSLSSAAAPAKQSREDEQASQSTQLQQGLQSLEIRPGVTYQGFTESQTRPTQQIPRVGETPNHHESENFNFANSQTQYPGQPRPEIGERGIPYGFRYRNDGEPQTQILGQPRPQIGETGNPHGCGYRNVGERQTQFQIGETGNHPEFVYRNVPQQQNQFPLQQFSQVNETYNPREFRPYTGAESQNLISPQRTQQAGEFGRVEEYSRYHPPLPIQQAYVNGTSTMPDRDKKSYLSVPLGDTSGGISGPPSYQSQNAADRRHSYVDSAPPVNSSPRRLARPQSNLPGSYYEDDLSDSSGSFPSSDSTAAEWEYTRDTGRERGDQDGLNNRGGHDKRRPRHERTGCHRCDRASSRREESRCGRFQRKDSHPKENREQPRRDRERTRTAHSEDFKTTTSGKPPQSSSSRPEANKSSWAGYFPFGASMTR